MGYSLLFQISLACIVVVEVFGQTTQMVQVGLEGSFFDPASLIAQVGDTITFVFSGDIHSVTQGSFQQPCLPLPGGFNSGLAGKGTNGSAPAPTWDLHITDVSQPIWFFCEATRPTSHCAAGMVGVINPPNSTAVVQFMAAAKQVSGTPAPAPTLTLSGQGAFATNSPIAPTTAAPSMVSTSSSVSTQSSTATAAATATAGIPKSKPNVAAIAGGVAGGAIVIAIILAFAIWSCYKRRERRRKAMHPAQYTYNSHPNPFSSPKSEVSGMKMHAETTPLQNAYTPPATAFSERTMAEEQSTPIRQWPAPMLHPGYHPQQFGIDRQTSFTSDNVSRPVQSVTPSSIPTLSQRPSNADIQYLANEVAAVLIASNRQAQQPSDTESVHSQSSQSRAAGTSPPALPLQRKTRPLPEQPRLLHTRDESEDDSFYAPSPPPNYRAAMTTVSEERI